jgi:uncharacterized protein YjbI with pentapeptide repeats
MRWGWLGVAEQRWKKAPDEEVRPAKTLWDWLQLLIVPAILIGVTFVWSATQTRSENKRDDRRIAADRAAAEVARRDATLQAYLDKMSGLMLDKKLLTSKPSDAVRPVARSLTLTTLRRLDGERKVALLRFLFEARLIDSESDVVDLGDADFRGVDLRNTLLDFADLGRANLAAANLGGAFLAQANLEGANLRDAKLVHAVSAHAHFFEANLAGADLRGAILREADLSFANLSRADLRGSRPSPRQPRVRETRAHARD